MARRSIKVAFAAESFTSRTAIRRAWDALGKRRAARRVAKNTNKVGNR